MTAKEYLLRYRRLSAQIRMVESEIAAIREEQALIRARLDGLPKGTEVSDRTALLATKLADMERDLIRIQSKAWYARMVIVDTIGSLSDPKQIEILYSRYVEGKSWGEIAESLDYTDRQVYRVHGWALKKVSEKLKDVSKCQLNL